MRIVLLEEAAVTTLPRHFQDLLAHHTSESATVPVIVIVIVEYINPVNLRALKVSQVFQRVVMGGGQGNGSPSSSSHPARRPGGPAGDGNILVEGRRFLEQQRGVVAGRVREMLERYRPAGIAQSSFFLGYSIMFVNSFGYEAQCLGYSAYGFEDTLRRIPGVVVSEGEIWVWERPNPVPTPPGPTSASPLSSTTTPTTPSASATPASLGSDHSHGMSFCSIFVYCVFWTII